jgi:signal-transduction protein with cAMP-binding, CBS, and nucleotidyltransferase domain
MRLEFSTHLYATHLAQIPIFRGLGASVTHALCEIVEPMLAVKSQVVYSEGSVGKEMYVLITGELEVTVNDTRLGFLSDGAFFGETPLLDNSPEAERRRRTVTAMIECKLCFITKESLNKIMPQYPELALKLKRCSRFNKNQVNKKGKRFKAALREATSSPLPFGIPSPMSTAETWTDPQNQLAPPVSPTAAAQGSDSAGHGSKSVQNRPRSRTALPKLVTPQVDQPSELSRRVDELQEMMRRMDARSEQMAKSVDAIMQHLKLHAAA